MTSFLLPSATDNTFSCSQLKTFGVSWLTEMTIYHRFEIPPLIERHVQSCSILPCIVMFKINSEYLSHWYSYACLTMNGESAFQYLRCLRWGKTNEEGIFQVFVIENPFWRPSIIMTELIWLCKRLCNLWWHVVFDIADLQTFQWHHLDRQQQTWRTTELPTLKKPSFSVNFFRRFWKTCNNLLHHFVRSYEKLFFFISTEIDI